MKLAWLFSSLLTVHSRIVVTNTYKQYTRPSCTFFNTNITIQFKYKCQLHGIEGFEICYSQVINIKYYSSTSHFDKFLIRVIR